MERKQMGHDDDDDDDDDDVSAGRIESAKGFSCALAAELMLY